jgi:hypothetical protein
MRKGGLFRLTCQARFSNVEIRVLLKAPNPRLLCRLLPTDGQTGSNPPLNERWFYKRLDGDIGEIRRCAA